MAVVESCANATGLSGWAAYCAAARELTGATTPRATATASSVVAEKGNRVGDDR